MYIYFKAVQETGAKLIGESDINTDDIQNRLEQLAKSWDELKQMAERRYNMKIISSFIMHCTK
jgi:hypothetical protein